MLALALVAVLAWPLVGPPSAVDAHAVVVSVSPPPGSLLESAPGEVVVNFNEPVSVDDRSIVVIDADGNQVSGPAVSGGATVTAPLDAGTTGWHAVSWYAVSADGHPVSGAWTFRVGDGDAAAPEGLEQRAAAASQPSEVSRWAFYLAQWLSTIAAVVVVGSLFVALLSPDGVARWKLAVCTATVGAAASALAAGLNGPYASVGSGWFDGPATGEYLLRAVALATVVIGLAATAPRRPSPRPRPVGAVLVALAAAGLAMPALTGHASAEGTTATVAVMAHLAVAGCWLGGIPALLLAVQRREPDASALLARFSRAATWVLAATIVGGLSATWALTGGPGNVSQTWGWALFVKVSLIGVAVTAGAWNRWNVVPHLGDSGAVGDRSDPDAEARPAPVAEARPALAIEALALVGVVIASIALTHNGPPQTAPGADRGPVVIDEVLEGDVRLQLIVDPARVGANDVHLFVLDTGGMPLDVAEVSTTIRSDAAGIGRIEVPFTNLGAGHYTTRIDDFGIVGTWQVEVVVRPDSFTEVVLADEVEIAP